MCKVLVVRNPSPGRRTLLLVISLGCAIGCGDNSKECGPGTVDEAGECVPAPSCGAGTVRDEESGLCVPDGSFVCSDGTVFDALTGTCKIDPSSCQGDTILVNNACVDPTAGLTVDVQEGPEPNGLDIVEASAAQAGNITIKPAGSSFVVHGSITPWRDVDGDGALDPDIDTYVLTVAGPTWLQVTADGVHGLTAGFYVAAAADAEEPVASWRRFGLDLAGDTSQRQIYLPGAGTYRLAIGDTRTLHEYLLTDSASVAPSGDYYVSITDLGSEPASTLQVTGNAATATGTTDGNIVFYSLPAGLGVNMASLAMPSQLVDASLVVMVNGALRAVAYETAQPARVNIGGGAPGDATLIVVDQLFDMSPSPAAFTLSVSTSNL